MSVSGLPSRIVSRKPCRAGMNTRSHIESMLMMLMPVSMLTMSNIRIPAGAGDALVQVGIGWRVGGFVARRSRAAPPRCDEGYSRQAERYPYLLQKIISA